MEQPINKTYRALGFVDNYSAWLVGESIDENIRSTQTAIIPKAEGWARESGAIFERSKTGLIQSIYLSVVYTFLLWEETRHPKRMADILMSKD
jgi:hypothetical protein